MLHFYKNSYDIEQYVYDIDIVKFRRILASFRSGEVYIENEFHFIFICPLYKCIREKCLQQAMYTNPCIEKLYSLFCSKSTTVIRNLACYLHQAFKIRKDFLNIYSLTNDYCLSLYIL